MNEEESHWIGKIKGDDSISHHEVIQFIFVFNTEDPIAQHNEYVIYLYNGKYFYASIIGKSVILIKVQIV